MPKRPSRENAKDRKASEDMQDDEALKTKRRNRKSSADVSWIKDNVLVISNSDDEEDDDDSTYVDEDDDVNVININVDGNSRIKIGIQANEEIDSGDAYEEFLSKLLAKYGSVSEQREYSQNPVQGKPKRGRPPKKIQPEIKLSSKEASYFHSLPAAKQKEYNSHMKKVVDASNSHSEVPLSFQVLSLEIPDYVKSNVLKKIASLEDESGETHKIRNWIDIFLRVPFGKSIPVPVTLSDGRDKCSEFMRGARATLDKAVFGMVPAKTQIMQVIAQWVANPKAVGNVIALQGPAGVGKTSIAKNGIAQALQRPFQFFSLGGASDVSNFVGHSYTYEGSMCGRILDSVMQAKCMNPVMYFDELDKVSTTAHGEEIISMLIHLTDRTQNSQFHDRYLAGIDIDLSQVLYVFSFNDLNAVNPILRDRMQVVQCSGYTEKEKQTILEDYVWPQLLERLAFSKSDIELSDSVSKFIISEYSDKEQGVRTLIRAAESIVTRLNMLRIADADTMKDYKFYMKLEFPLKLTEQIIKTVLIGNDAKEVESWRTMYT